MAQMNISIPDQLKAWVEARVADGSYASSSDYVRDLVRQDQREQAMIAKFQAEIEHGRASGISERSLSQIIKETRAKRQPRAAA
jgi:antitoxin ParD1/3/4